MKKFRFQLETLLKVTRMKKEEAEVAFAEAVRRLDEARACPRRAGWAPGGETTASCSDDCADCADGADWGWLLREARAASTAGSPRVPNHSRRAG